MAGGKETPRQKMIGMMYLVLLALLAMNVSNEVLDAFVRSYYSLENSKENSLSKTNKIYTDFDNAFKLNPSKVKKFNDVAIQIQENTNELVLFVEDLKKKLISQTEGIPQEVADTIQVSMLTKQDNYDVPTYFMLGTDELGETGEAMKLKSKLNDYNTFLKESLNEKDKKDFKSSIILDDVIDKTGEKKNWQLANFFHSPQVATLASLSKLQNDVKNTEIEVLSKLYSYISAEDFPIDTVSAKVLANSSYILQGSNYEADVFLAAYNTTKNPEIILEDGTVIPVENGVGKIRFPASSVGNKEISGILKVFKKSGEAKEYPFKSSYVVAQPSATISADGMNILYKGIDNPVSVSVPGISSDKLSVEITGAGNKIAKLSNGTFKVNLSNSSADKVEIIAKAKMDDGSVKLMGRKEYKVFNIPKPDMNVLGKTEDGDISLAALKQTKVIKAKQNESFLFNIQPVVKSYEVSAYVPGKMPFEIGKGNGERLSNSAIDKLKIIPKGATVTFKAKIMNPDGRIHKLSINLEVK